MKIDYIIVQAGGKGTRMQYLTRNKPKALVPVDNLPILFHLFKRFPHKKYIIIADYKADVMNKYLEAFAKVEYILVDGKGKKGTCGGLRKSLEMLPGSCPFMLIWSDLILPDDFSFPSRENNYIGLSKDFPCRWCKTEDKIEEISSSDAGIAGLFIFKNKEMLSDVPEEGEFVRWLSERNISFQDIPLYKTKEYGLLSEYNRMKEQKNRCRPFNKIEVNGNKVIKTAVDEQGKELAVREKAWYRTAQENDVTAIPEIYSFDPLIMQKIEGLNVFEYKLNEEEQKDILRNIVGGA